MLNYRRFRLITYVYNMYNVVLITYTTLYNIYAYYACIQKLEIYKSKQRLQSYLWFGARFLQTYEQIMIYYYNYYIVHARFSLIHTACNLRVQCLKCSTWRGGDLYSNS